MYHYGLKGTIMAITTLLFDMDSTLIDIDEILFSKTYFKLLHECHFSDFDLGYFCDSLTEITKFVMLSKIPKEFTLDTFVKEMSKKYKRDPKDLYNNLLHFYNNEYESLNPFVRPIKGVKKMLKYCFKEGYNVVVATTPVFPEVAIRKRLKWGGLEKFDFKLVTHAGNMHFSKPREEYYQEVLFLIGKKKDECIMVGNEFMSDIVGPTRMGLKTFYCPLPTVNDDLFVSPELKRFSKIKPTYRGTINDFAKLIADGL